MMKARAARPTSIWLAATLAVGAAAFAGCSRGGSSSYDTAASASAAAWEEPAPAESGWGDRQAAADEPRLREEPTRQVRSDQDLWFMRSGSDVQPVRQESSFNDPRFEQPRIVQEQVPHIVPPQPPGPTQIVQPIRTRPPGWRNRRIIRDACD